MPEPQEAELLALTRRLTILGVERAEQSSERSYLNAERNLAVAVHAAVALMILGLAIDRYQLYQNHAYGPAIFYGHFIARAVASWSPAALVGLGVLSAFVGGLRYLAFVIEYRRRHALLLHYGPLLAPVLALLVAVFGLVTLAPLFVAGR